MGGRLTPVEVTEYTSQGLPVFLVLGQPYEFPEAVHNPMREGRLATTVVQFGESAEMYLKTIAELTTFDTIVAISSVADRLDVSSVSATEMVHRLEDRSLVEHLPYKGVRLTSLGWGKATSVIRRHRLWEVFLVELLGYPWEQVHGLACRLEHASDSDLTERLAGILENPKTCPHGNLIPVGDLDGREDSARSAGCRLSEMGIGESGRLLSIHPESDPLLEYLGKRGLVPGVVVSVEELAILDGPISVRVGGTLEVIGRAIAAHLFVERDSR